MTYPFVQAGSYRAGRRRPIRLLVLHATQSPCAGYAPRIAGYFAGGPGVSSHYVCDDTTTIQCVDDDDTAFTAPNANADGLHIEQCGYSEWSTTEWLSGPPARMLEEQVAPLVARLAARHGIPLRWLTPAQVAAGEAGLCQHIDVTNAYPGTGSHWDCGPHYPKDRVLELVSGTTTTEDDLTPEQAQQLAELHAMVNPARAGVAHGYLPQLVHELMVDTVKKTTPPGVGELAESVASLRGDMRALTDAIRQMAPGGTVDADDLAEKVAAAIVRQVLTPKAG